LLLLLVCLSEPLHGTEQKALVGTGDVIVLFDEEPLGAVAREVVDFYPGVKAELEETLGWRVDFRPKILLIGERRKFQDMAGSNYFAAYAVPEGELVVIDYSRMNRGVFTLSMTLKHELCHLLLHRYIPKGNLPRWLDEGISQWVSEGVSEMVTTGGRSLLRGAALTGRCIPLDRLAEGFPGDRRSLLLAYEESRSFVEYVSSEYGREAVLDMLNQLRNGGGVKGAFLKTLSVPLEKLERQWLEHLRRGTTWLVYLADHLYGILFFLAALITVWGFIKVLARKKRYAAGQDDGVFPD